MLLYNKAYTSQHHVLQADSAHFLIQTSKNLEGSLRQKVRRKFSSRQTRTEPARATSTSAFKRYYCAIVYNTVMALNCE